MKEKNDIQEALKCLQKAKALEPDNSSILKEIKSVTALLQKQKNYEKELAKRMFSSSTDTSKSKKEVRKSSVRAKTTVSAGYIDPFLVPIKVTRVKVTRTHSICLILDDAIKS